MDADAVLDGLDAAQTEAVLNPHGPLAILAPAGAGKTRVLTRRIARRVADGSADAGHVLVLTFTRAAASEVVGRLNALGLRDRPTAGTFHGVAWAVLRQRWADERRRAPDLVPSPLPLLREVAKGRPGSEPAAAAAVAAELEWARARLIGPDGYEEAAQRNGRRSAVPPARIAELFGAYEATKRARHLVDFADLLALCTRELERDRAFAEVQRWRFRHLFVDEFQDVNPLQHALLEAWRSGRPDLCVVGDVNQAIYGWNGADPRWLAEFAALYPGSAIVRLTTNYRTTPQILAAAGAVLPKRANGRAAPPDDAPATPPGRPDGPSVTIHAFEDEVAECAGVVRLVRDLRPGRRWSSCAVLVRTRAQAAALEAAFRSAGVPARARGTVSLLDEPIVRQALRDAALHREPGALRSWLDAAALPSDDPEDAVPPPPALMSLMGLAEEFVADEPGATVGAFRGWLAAGGGEGLGGGDAVEICTFHAAKGLEWPVVVVAGLERGLVPHASAATADAKAEEGRLLHVALTRAEHRLACTWAQRRHGRRANPSPYLVAIEGSQAAEPPVAPPPELVVARAKHAPAPADPLLGALERWRRAAARAAGVPENVVCTDAALRAVARARPHTVDELAALPELGPAAARRVGPRLLAVVAGTSTSAGAGAG